MTEQRAWQGDGERRPPAEGAAVADAAAPFRRGLGIAAKLVIAQLLVLTLVIPTLAGYLIARQQAALGAELASRAQDTRHAMRVKALALARNLAVVSESAVKGYDFSFLRQVISTTASADPELEQVAVIDDQARVVAHTDPRYAGETQNDPQVRAALASSGIEASEVKRDGKSRLEVFAPLREGTRRFGVLRLVFTLDLMERSLAEARLRIDAQARDAWRRSVMLTAVIAALGVVVAILFSLRIRRPVRTLVRAATDVAAGQVDRRVAVGAHDEIGELGHAFNFLADRIERLLSAAREHAAVENELEVARRIQRMLLPPTELHDFGPLAFAGTVLAASQCSGDFWYWARLHDQSLLIVLGDVEGHGVPAAIFGATARGYLDTLPLLREGADTSAASVAALLTDLNRAIYGAGRGEVFMTCIALIVDPVRAEVRYANAGNVLPYLYRAPNTFLTLAAHGNPLGSAPVLSYKAATTPLRPGDVLAVFTDGLVEAQVAGRSFGERRVRQIVQQSAAGSPAEVRGGIIAAVQAFLGEKHLEDDITFVAVQFRAQLGRGIMAGPGGPAS